MISGEWRNFKSTRLGMHYGSITLNDGSIYDGEFKNDKFHQNGTIIYSDGKKYQGKWFEGEYFGQGTVIYPNGKEFSGFFRNGFLGNGIYKFRNLIDFWRGILFWIYFFTE